MSPAITERPPRSHLALSLLFLLTGCTAVQQPLVTERGQWSESMVPAHYIVYHARPDATEDQLAEALKPIARKLAAKNAFVVQVAVYDDAWADYLIQPETQQHIMNNELPVGTDLIMHSDMQVQGGLVYTYYRDGDYDEFFYWPRQPR